MKIVFSIVVRSSSRKTFLFRKWIDGKICLGGKVSARNNPRVGRAWKRDVTRKGDDGKHIESKREETSRVSQISGSDGVSYRFDKVRKHKEGIL